MKPTVCVPLQAVDKAAAEVRRLHKEIARKIRDGSACTTPGAQSTAAAAQTAVARKRDLSLNWRKLHFFMHLYFILGSGRPSPAGIFLFSLGVFNRKNKNTVWLMAISKSAAKISAPKSNHCTST